MTVLTEAQHTGEFLLSEAPGTLSREKGILTSGVVVADGDVLALSAGKLVRATQAEGSEVLVGIAYGAHDATGGDLADVPYIARLAEVKLDLIQVNASESEPDSGVLAELAGLFIISR